jgi:hypothetical protein
MKSGRCRPIFQMPYGSASRFAASAFHFSADLADLRTTLGVSVRRRISVVKKLLLQRCIRVTLGYWPNCAWLGNRVHEELTYSATSSWRRR